MSPVPSPGERAEADRAARQVAIQPRPQQHLCPLAVHLDPPARVHAGTVAAPSHSVTWNPSTCPTAR